MLREQKAEEKRRAERKPEEVKILVERSVNCHCQEARGKRRGARRSPEEGEEV